MLKRIINVLLVSVVLAVGLTASVAMASTSGPAGPNPDLSDRGQPNADEPKDTGKPDDPNAWGSVAAQLADEGVMGEHSSDPVPFVPGHETPRDGLGNVARNDLGDHGVTVSCSDTVTTNCDPGSQLPAHGCVAAAAPLPGIKDENGDPIQPDCALDPQEIHG